VNWRGKPLFIRHRTPEEIKTAEAGAAVPSSAIRSPDNARVTDTYRQEGAGRNG